jgi:hypothetical protein
MNVPPRHSVVLTRPYDPGTPQLMAPMNCLWCECFPCVCRIRSRTLPCACGGTVTADPSEPAQGVQLHQREAIHRMYRARFV